MLISLKNVLIATAKDFMNDNCMRVSAALAYYTIFSLPPLLILITSICGVLFDPTDVEGYVAGYIKSVLGPSGADQVRSLIHSSETTNKGTFTNILGGIALLFGASGVVVQLQSALNDIWEVKPDPETGGIINFIRKRVLSFGMVLGIAFLLLVSLVMTTILTSVSSVLLPGEPSKIIVGLVNLLVSIAASSALFAGIFKILPDAEVRWRNVWTGAVITAVLFEIGKFGLGIYFSYSEIGSAYGVAGSVVLLLVWIYYAAILFMFGAEFTQAWAHEQGQGIMPSDGAVRIVTEVREVNGPGQKSRRTQGGERLGDSTPPADETIGSTAIGNNWVDPSDSKKSKK